MENNNIIKEGEIIAFFDAALYSRNVVLKCLYWYGDKFHTGITLVKDTAYRITLQPLANANIKEEELDYYLQKLERDLIDYHLREVVTKESANVRELLVAKAFSNGEFDEQPIGEVSDTVGFDPFLIQP